MEFTNVTEQTAKASEPRISARESVAISNQFQAISDDMKSMNWRIFGGVIFCTLLLVATFAVNVIAFDFARDQETQNNMMVDKRTGEVVDYHTQLVDTTVTELSLPSLMKLRTVADFNNFGSYWVSSVEVRPCPAGNVELAEKYCADLSTEQPKMFIVTGTAGQTLVANSPKLNGIVGFYLVPKEDMAFIEEAKETTWDKQRERHLLVFAAFINNGATQVWGVSGIHQNTGGKPEDCSVGDACDARASCFDMCTCVAGVCAK